MVTTTEDKNFTMAEQCKMEKPETHSSALKTFLKILYPNETAEVNPMYQKHVSHKDFEFAIIERNYEGNYEGKHDTWATSNTVMEIAGSVSKEVLDKHKIPFPKYKSQIFNRKKNEALYDKIHDFLLKLISKEINGAGIKLGYGAVGTKETGEISIFGYFRRALERVKNEENEWVETGKILYRKVYMYEGKVLRKIVMKHFLAKDCLLQIVANKEKAKYPGDKDRYWASINVLIKDSLLLPALKAVMHMENDDITVKNVTKR